MAPTCWFVHRPIVGKRRAPHARLCGCDGDHKMAVWWAYRWLHFARMGFDDALNDLEARRQSGARDEEIADAAPDDLLLATAYFGPPTGAAAAFRRLAEGLDVALVRVVPARPGPEAVLQTMRACING